MKIDIRSDGERESIIRLRTDLVTASILVWVARAGRAADLTPEAHLYFADRYHRLAAYHRRRGHHARADLLQAKADDYFALGGGEGPPYSAAMAMPRLRSWTITEAVSARPARGPDDAA